MAVSICSLDPPHSAAPVLSVVVRGDYLDVFMFLKKPFQLPFLEHVIIALVNN